VKNEEFYPQLLAGLVTHPDRESSAKLIGEETRVRLKSEVELFISFKNETPQLFYSRPLNIINETRLQEYFLNSNFFAGQEIKELGSASLTKLVRTKHLLYLPKEVQTEEKIILLIGRSTVPFSKEEKETADFLADLFASSVKIIQALELNKAMEAQLIQRQKFESLGKLTSGIAHDFSNLLSSIFGSVNLLKKKLPENSDAIRLIDNIESCSVRAKDLTSGLLAYGKPKPKQKEIFSPNKLANEIAGVVKQTFPATISFHLHLNDEIYPIKGNSIQIYQVLLNLCINARDAVGKHGSISLFLKNVSVLPANGHLFPFLSEGNYICFSVEDTGGGISEENLSKIFDPYFTTKANESSSGLGLYISYGIIKAHDGVIQVASRVNEGTRFDVYLPAYEDSSADEKKIAEKIILLADDEEMLQDLLAELLESHGYYVIKVPNGTELLQVLTEEIKADLAIIDYNMPVMNGAECIAKIREHGFMIPVILSSGSMSFAGKNEISGLQIDAVVTKPYDFDTMLATVQKLL